MKYVVPTVDFGATDVTCFPDFLVVYLKAL